MCDFDRSESINPVNCVELLSGLYDKHFTAMAAGQPSAVPQSEFRVRLLLRRVWQRAHADACQILIRFQQIIPRALNNLQQVIH